MTGQVIWLQDTSFHSEHELTVKSDLQILHTGFYSIDFSADWRLV